MDLYEVKELLGAGTYGSVYRVYHRIWQIDLAVKSLHYEFSERDHYKKNFLKECEEWVKLGLHPNIVSCHYVRNLGGVPRIFLECAEGGSLSSCLNKIKDFREIISLSLQCFTGLSFAHRKGLVHRDIKPANCLLTDRGQLKITDFGIACTLFSSGEEISAAGTPAYMPPEQWDISYGDTGPWSDIYSAGIMIYEMCCKCRPFDRGVEHSGILKLRHISSPPPHPSEFNREIPHSLSDFILKCLEKSPYNRFSSCDEAIKRLAEIYEEVTGETYPFPGTDEIKLMADSLNNRAVSLMDLAMKKEAAFIWEEALSLNPLHVQSVYNRGLVRWREGEIDDLQLLDEISILSAEHEVYYLSGLVHLERDDPVSALEFFKKIPEPYESELQKSMAYAEKRDGNCSSLIKKIFNNGYQPVERLSLGGDNRWAFGAGMDYLKIHIPSGEIPERVRGSGIISVMTDRYGKICLTSYANGVMKLTDIFTGKEIKTLKAPWTLKLSYINSDGSLIVAVDICNYIYVWDISTENMLKKIEGIKEKIIAVHITPDNKYLIYGTEDGTFTVIEVSAFEIIKNFHLENSFYSISFSCDGHKALLMDYRANVIFIDVFSGACLRSFKSVEFFKRTIRHIIPSSVSLNYDGSLAVMPGNSVKLVRTSTGKCLRSFQGHNQKVYSTVMDSDGTLVVSGDEMGQIKVWKIADFNYIAPFRLSKITTAEETKEIQSEYARLVKQAACAVENREIKEAISFLKKARTLPGYEQSPDGLRLWAYLTGICKKICLRNSWIEKTFTVQEDMIYGVYIIDNNFMVLGSSKNIPGLWDVLKGERIKIFEGNYGEITCASLNPEGTFLIAGYRDGTVRLFTVSDGKNIKTFEGHRKKIDFLSMNDMVVSYSYNDLKIWHMDGTLIKNPYAESLRCLSLSRDRKVLFSCGNNIRVFHNGNFVKILEGSSKNIQSLSFAGNSRFVLSGGSDLILWDISSGKPLRVIGGEEGDIKNVSLSFDGRFALSGTSHSFDRNKKSLKLWDLSTGALIRTMEVSQDYKSIQLSRDGNFLVTADSERTIKLWRLDWELEESDMKEWHETSESLIENFIESPSVNCYDHPLTIKNAEPPSRHASPVTRHDSHIYLTGSFKVPGDMIYTACISNDGRLALSAGGYVILWNMEDGRALMKSSPYVGTVRSVYLSYDNRLIAAGYEDGKIRFWNESGECLNVLEGHTGRVSSLSVTGDMLVSAGIDRIIKIWHIPSAALIKTLAGHSDEIWNLIVDGNNIYSGSKDKSVKLWELSRGECVKTFTGHNDSIRNISVCSGGKFLLSSSMDGVSKLWNVLSGDVVKNLEPCGRAILADDGRRIFYISGDSICLYDIDSDTVEKLDIFHKGLNFIQVTPDSSFMLTSDMSGHIKRWTLDREL